MKLKTNNHRARLAVTLVSAAALSATACGSKKKSDDTETTSSTSSSVSTPGVTKTDSNTVALAGTIALTTSSLNLADAAPTGVIAFNLASGQVIGAPQKVDVAADGTFTVPVGKTNAAVDTLQAQAALAPADRDWDAMVAAVNEVMPNQGVTAAKLKAMSEDEIQQGIAGLATQLHDAGAMTMLVAYTKSDSGDVVAEAQSFHFINMPTAGGQGLAGIPTGNLLGSLNFGKISGAGADVTSELTADEAINLPAAAIENFASAGKALKMVKNYYMNTKWGVEPFYAWSGHTAPADVIDKFSDVTKATYKGYGFYVKQQLDQGLTYDQVCGGKTILFTPPAAIDVASGSSSANTTMTGFTNAGATKTTQGSNRICNGNGFYAREDVQGSDISFMLNYGTGGGIQTSPEGLWTMTIADTNVGNYDLALGSPVDADGNPLVFLPQVKFVKTGANITSAVIELYGYNPSTKSYDAVTDFSAAKALISEMQVSASRTSDNGESRAHPKFNDDGTISGAFDGSESEDGKVVNPAVAVADVSGFSFSYQIGSANYRMEYRGEQ